MTATLRIRLAAASLLLVGLALVQSPGLLVPDTKFDLVEAPLDFLGRALHLWDAEAAFGQLQNQAYGYLWPMGPFFAFGWLLDLPGWVVQRLWLALVMVTAFQGAARLARALGVRSDLACLVAGFAFALSPRMLTVLGPISIEAWPSALAPWVLLPLVLGSRGGSPRRAAALSALAVAMVGGVNAAATFAVIPLGAVWLLTREPGPRRRSLMLWWPVFTLLGTLWWLVPLFTLGAYSPPFLDYIETTAVTTVPTTLFDTLRGTSNWVPYVDAASRAGNDLITIGFLALDSAVLLLLGFAGLIGARSEHRLFLSLSLLVGVFMVGAGHLGATEGWFASDVRGALDGVLAPLRNVHKFDPVIRLPLVIGLALVIDRAVQHEAPDQPHDPLAPVRRYAVVGMAVVALVGSVVPVLTGRVTPAGALFEVPGYWRQTADWLNRHGDDGTSLLVPGAAFGDYAWGSPKDEPLQYLSDSPWAVRNVIPLTPQGNIRMLDAIESWLVQGRGSEGLTAYLRRAGVRHLVVRNDLAANDDVPGPVLVHQALEQSPGITRVASFGPAVGGAPVLEGPEGRIVVNGGWQTTYPAVEVYRVSGDVEPAVSAEWPATVVGGPEDLLDLADLGLIGPAPVVLGVHQEETPYGPVVLTDGLRARERTFSRLHDSSSPVLTAADISRTSGESRDYRLDSDDRWSTTARLEGARSVTASSSRSDAGAPGGTRPAEQPYAAVDGHDATQWVSQAGIEPAWWRLDLDRPVEPETVRLVGGADAPRGQTVLVRTEAGATGPVALGPGEARQVRLPAGETRWVRVEDASRAEGRPLALAGVDVPGVEVLRRLVLPTVPEDWGTPDTVVLRAQHDARQGCAEVDGDVRCVEGRDRTGEEPLGIGRVVDLPGAASWSPRLLVRPRPGRALDRMILHGQLLDLRASSRAVPDPRSSPVAAIDGDPRTTWLAATDDLRPTVQLRWLGARPISSLEIRLEEETAARRPLEVTLRWPGGRTEVELDGSGRATFPEITTDQLIVQVERADAATALGFDATAIRTGVGISELRLGTFLPAPPSDQPVDYRCGSGPDLTVNGRSYESAISASPADLARGSLVEARLCDPTGAPVATVETHAGENTIDAAPGRGGVLDSLVLTDGAQVTAGPAATPADVVSGPAERTLVPAPDSRLVVLRQNANPGWQAEQHGTALPAVVVDGWQQGWRVAGEAPVQARFTPDGGYRVGLLLGALGALALVAAVLLTGRRTGRPHPAALGGREAPVTALVAVAAVGAGLAVGWVGALLALLPGVGVLALRRAGRPVPAWTAWLWAAPALAVGVWYSFRPWADPAGWAGSSPWSAYLMVLPLSASLVAAASLRPRRSAGGRFFRARAGRSTSR